MQNLNSQPPLAELVSRNTSFPLEDYYFNTDADEYYCRKCNTSASLKVIRELKFHNPVFDSLFGGVKYLRCICECEKEKIEQEKIQQIRQNHALHKQKIISAEYADKNFAKMVFAADNGSNPRLTEICKKFVGKFSEMYKSGAGLYLWGRPGTGKTFFAAAICNSLLEKIDFGKPHSPYTNAAIMRINSLVDKIYKSSNNQNTTEEIMDRLRNFDLVLLDDLGAEGSTEYRLSQVFNLIETRYTSQKPTIITSNLSIAEYAAKSLQHERIADRIFEMCVPIEVKGSTQRKNDRILKLIME
jgi:DNA replication protein DnaC